MSNRNQFKGMLLEEAILYLLKRSGYNTIEHVGNDPTLCMMGGGIGVRGRGCSHQIDAIASFRVLQPFTNPQRLMVEGKCYDSRRKVTLNTVRNALGVLKDISEYWNPTNQIQCKKRFHYNYAIFSASAFTSAAQEYAFAQDIYLLPLGRNRFFRPLIRSIENAADDVTESIDRERTDLASYRIEIRRHLSDLQDSTYGSREPLRSYFVAIRQLKFSMIAILEGGLPIFLSPSPKFISEIEPSMPEELAIRIFWDSESWYLTSPTGEVLFSFDLPEELFDLYKSEGLLTPERALELKSNHMSRFQSFYVEGEKLRIIRLSLDAEWISQMRGGA